MGSDIDGLGDAGVENYRPFGPVELPIARRDTSRLPIVLPIAPYGSPKPGRPLDPDETPEGIRRAVETYPPREPEESIGFEFGGFLYLLLTTAADLLREYNPFKLKEDD